MRNRASGVVLLFVFTLAMPVRGQTPSGEISGIVTDASGLAVPGVTVTLTNSRPMSPERSRPMNPGCT